MNSLQLSYSGRLSFGVRGRISPCGRRAAPKTAWQVFIAGFTAEHGAAEAARLILALGLSTVTNLQKSPQSRQRARRGLAGISGPGRVRVESAASLLQERYGRHRLSFLTLTIAEECLNTRLLENWTEMTRKLRQWLAYHLTQGGLSGEVVGVAEIQEGRQAVGGLPCLHWHLVFVGKRNGGAWVITKESIREYWKKLQEEHSGEQVVTRSATRIENVKKSASGYLGKYISKGSKAVKLCNPTYIPSSWIMLSRSLVRKVNALTIKIQGQLAEQLYDYFQQNQHLFSFSRFVEKETPDGFTYCLGWYGKIQNRAVFHGVRRDLIACSQLVKSN